MSGLKIAGKLYQVPGVRVLSPDQESWVKLDDRPGRADGVPRATRPQYKVMHKTIADDIERFIPGAGYTKATGGAEYTARYWYDNADHSGAHIVTGFDGSSACLEDLVTTTGFHCGAADADGNRPNQRSWGHELKEVVGGGCYHATYAAAAAITKVDTSKVGVQWQVPDKFRGPLDRFDDDGGRTVIGVVGHRDITGRRNQHDPGSYIFNYLKQVGFESFDFKAKQDLDVWSRRQAWLKREGVYAGAIDGVAFLKTRDALRKLGLPDGILMRHRELVERDPRIDELLAIK